MVVRMRGRARPSDRGYREDCNRAASAVRIAIALDRRGKSKPVGIQISCTAAPIFISKVETGRSSLRVFRPAACAGPLNVRWNRSIWPLIDAFRLLNFEPRDRSKCALDLSDESFAERLRPVF